MLKRIAVNLLCLGTILAKKTHRMVASPSIPDGWRRTVGVALRGLGSRFALAHFGLRLPSSQKDIGTFLGRFFTDEPESQFFLEHHPSEVQRISSPVRLVLGLNYTSEGQLKGIEFYPTETSTELSSLKPVLERILCDVFNQTQHLPESQRSRQLLIALKVASNGNGLLWDWLQKAFRAPSFTMLDTPERDRFAMPDFRFLRPLGGHFFHLVWRASEGSADLWLNVHHLGADGVPSQEVLGRLVTAWGLGEEILFPDSGTILPTMFVSDPDDRAIYCSLAFLNLQPLLQYRKEQNRLLEQPLPVSAYLQWLLGQHPEFQGRNLASTSDIPASHGCDRQVNLVAVKPSEHPPTPEGFRTFATFFQQRLAEGRSRTGSTQAAMRDTSLLPAWLSWQALKLNPKAVAKTFGHLCISIVKGTQVFVGSLSDVGFEDGFIAVGNTNLPSQSGGIVTAITFKGTREQVERYPQLLQEMVNGLTKKEPGLVAG